MKCSYEACNRRARIRGMCARHYAKWRDTLEGMQTIARDKKLPFEQRSYYVASEALKCTVPDCDSPRYGRGLCTKHYMQWNRAGAHAEHVLPSARAPTPCALGSCNEPIYLNRLCKFHFYRFGVRCARVKKGTPRERRNTVREG